MAASVGAPISAVLQLEPTVTAEQITGALTDWLDKTYGVGLESAEHDGLMVEWRHANEAPFVCQLIASDSAVEARRTVTVVCDDGGAVAIIEESPFATADVPHTAVDLSEPVQLLLSLLVPYATPVLDLPRGAVHDLAAVDPAQLLEALSQELAPGLLVAVIAGNDAPVSSSQKELLDDLIGLTLIGTISAGADLLGALGLPTLPRGGSVISVSRTPDGLDAHAVPSTSLRTKTDSARRLIVRRQLAAPVPFDLERRRSLAMARLITGGGDIDLPAAMQLWEEETARATELEKRVKELEALLENAYEEQDAALGQLDSTQSQLRYLQKAYKELGEVAIVEAEDDDEWFPESSVDALVAARESLPFLVIGAVDDTCGTLDGQQKRTIWAKKIWSSLRALNDYCRAKTEGRFSGDISMYRDNPPEGAIPLLAEYAPTESKSTTDDSTLVAARTFKVPTEVDPSGKSYMQQHVKIDKGGALAPRIHLHDDSGGSTERIYIGYVGPHLPTAGGF